MRRSVLVVIGVFSALIGLGLFLPSATGAAPPPASDDISINGMVAGPPPSTPPTIEEPAPNTTFTTKSITVKGSCMAGLVVKIYRNNFFAGSALCQPDGTYSLNIDLFQGENSLVARQFDAIGQASPDSNVVNVFYSPEQPPTPLPDTPRSPGTNQSRPGSSQPSDAPAIAQFQLIIEYDYTLQAIYAGTPFYLPVKFAGGTGPYAVSIDWGDGTNDVYSRTDTSSFTIDHTYEKAGYYTVSMKVSDSKGNKASLQFVLLVNGKPDDSLIKNVFTSNNGVTLFTYIAGGIVLLLVLIAVFLLGMKAGKSHKEV